MAKMRNGKRRKTDGSWAPLKDNQTDRQNARIVPQTPQTLSPSYRLAYADDDFCAGKNCARCVCNWNC